MSVLLPHAARLRDTDWRTAHVDFSRVADLTDVSRRLAAAYAGLDATWVRAHLSGLLSRLGVTFGAAGPGISVALRPPAPDAAAAETVLERLLDLPLSLWEVDRRAQRASSIRCLPNGCGAADGYAAGGELIRHTATQPPVLW